ncbi:F-box only protein 8-like [Symsagittifera roscoffensis]|uniref:F-box only protein 8-like n=1 Tax=Symsagittifera roscoffensis TaxID=84072 RepID=UPI00307B3867
MGQLLASPHPPQFPRPQIAGDSFNLQQQRDERRRHRVDRETAGQQEESVMGRDDERVESDFDEVEVVDEIRRSNIAWTLSRMGLLFGGGDERGPAGSFGRRSRLAFPDLARLPAQVSLSILSHLNETELCLAACVNEQWRQLADDDLLWLSLCKSCWGYTSVYGRGGPRGLQQMSPLKNVFLLLDEATLTFNSHSQGPQEGIHQLVDGGVLDDCALEIAKFIHCTDKLRAERVRRYLETRPDVLSNVISFQHFGHSFLPNALRTLFRKIEAPTIRGDFLETLLNCFAHRFTECNPDQHLSSDEVYVLCFSLILLSVDMHSPHVKTKMSKREFIRNVRGAITAMHTNPDQQANTQQLYDYDEMVGHMYDNIYLIGHVANAAASTSSSTSAGRHNNTNSYSTRDAGRNATRATNHNRRNHILNNNNTNRAPLFVR